MSKPTIDPTLPPIVQSFLASGARLESIRLDEEGNWWHRGVRFDNKRLMALFSSSVGRTEGGTWVLEIPPFTYPIEVVDVGYFVQRIEIDDVDGKVQLHLLGGHSESLNMSTLRYEEGRGFWCRIKEGRFEARFKRSAYYALAEQIEISDSGEFELKLGAECHRIVQAQTRTGRTV